MTLNMNWKYIYSPSSSVTSSPMPTDTYVKNSNLPSMISSNMLRKEISYQQCIEWVGESRDQKGLENRDGNLDLQKDGAVIKKRNLVPKLRQVISMIRYALYLGLSRCQMYVRKPFTSELLNFQCRLI